MKKVQSFFTKLLLVMAVISICLNGLGMFAKVHADTAAFQMMHEQLMRLMQKVARCYTKKMQLNVTQLHL